MTPPGPSEPTPTTGAMQRFVIDDVSLPTTEDEATAAGSDLDGNGAIDNEIGNVIEALSTVEDVRDDASVRSLIDHGAVPSSIEIFDANGDADGAVIGLAFFGRQTDEPSVLRGTALGSGFATDGLQATTTTVVLPVFLDADPTPIPLAFAQYQLVPDATGFELGIQGMAEPVQTAEAACTSLLQMITADPAQFTGVVASLDGNGDGKVTQAECLASSAIKSLLSPDVEGPDRQHYVSVGIDVHVFAPRDIPPSI
jgi:hypothetical protein